ncbi:MAG: 30S ribosomal protein S8 [Candidatus Aenigmarchaeota archaeon]|nr:30S ribosomal protein S8 [Candidatus Aenigmarchaeota archaeon]
MIQDTLADVLSVLKNADRVGKRDCITRASRLVKDVLTVLHEKGYIGSFDFVDDGKSGKYKVELKGKIIDCNVIKPRFSVKTTEFEGWEKRFLPARDFGFLIVTTPNGIMDHKTAKETKSGGKLVAFVY